MTTNEATMTQAISYVRYSSKIQAEGAVTAVKMNVCNIGLIITLASHLLKSTATKGYPLSVAPNSHQVAI